MKLFARLSGVAGLALAGMVISGCGPAYAVVQYVKLCDTIGAGWFIVPGTDECINAVTRQVINPYTGQTLQGGANLAVEGVAVALAMPTPVIGHGDRFAVAGNFASYEDFYALGFAGAFRLTDTANLVGSIAYGLTFGTFGAQVGLNVSLGDGKFRFPHDDSSASVMARDGSGFTSNAAVYGGLMQFDYPENQTLRSFDRDWIFGGLVRAGWRNHRGIGTQFDVWASTYDPFEFEGGQSLGDNPSTDTVGVGAHLNRRIGDSILGGFASLGSRSDRSSFLGTAGLEDRTTRGRYSLYGQLGYTFNAERLVNPLAHPRSPSDFMPNGVVYGHVSAAYFPQPNLMIEVNGGAAYAPSYGGIYRDALPGNDTWWYRWGAQIEYRPDNRSFGIFAEYEGLEQLTSFAPTFGGEYMENRILAGLRFYQPGTTLLDNTANGASLTDYNPVYGVNRSIQ